MSKILFLITGTALALTGVLHLVDLFTAPVDPNAIVPVVLMGLLALTYLAIAILLLMRKETSLIAGIIAPIIGLLLALAFKATSSMLVAFIVLDIITVAICGFLYSQSRVTIHRLR